MEENLANHRRTYNRSALDSEKLKKNPMDLFKIWFDETETADTIAENNAMTLSAIDAQGFPKNRVVLLKEFNDNGFVFYTNYNSEKAKSILQNPKVSLSFFWPKLERQVIVKGTAKKISEEDSDKYFASRPRGSQLGAWVSHQSQPIESRKILEDRLAKLKIEFDEKPIKRPEFWGGFLVKPVSIEFWQGRPNRLHDRFKYTLENEKWIVWRLAP